MNFAFFILSVLRVLIVLNIYCVQRAHWHVFLCNLGVHSRCTLSSYDYDLKMINFASQLEKRAYYITVLKVYFFFNTSKLKCLKNQYSRFINELYRTQKHHYKI